MALGTMVITSNIKREKALTMRMSLNRARSRRSVGKEGGAMMLRKATMEYISRQMAITDSTKEEAKLLPRGKVSEADNT